MARRRVRVSRVRVRVSFRHAIFGGAPYHGMKYKYAHGTATEVLLVRLVDQFVRPSTGLSIGDTIALGLLAHHLIPLEASTSMTLRVYSFLRQPLSDWAKICSQAAVSQS